MTVRDDWGLLLEVELPPPIIDDFADVFQLEMTSEVTGAFFLRDFVMINCQWDTEKGREAQKICVPWKA